MCTDTDFEPVRRCTNGVTIHPEYRIDGTDTPRNDLAVLKLATPVTKQQQPIAVVTTLATPGYPNPRRRGTALHAAGWGRTGESAPTAARLRDVVVPLLDDEQCALRYAEYGYSADEMLCAGLPEGGKDGCFGDSGGPLFYEDTSVDRTDPKRYQLVGVVSWGVGCAREGFPGVYADLAGFSTDGKAFADWLVETTDGDIRTSCEWVDAADRGYEIKTRTLDDETCSCTAADRGCKPRARFRLCTETNVVPAEPTCAEQKLAYVECILTVTEVAFRECNLEVPDLPFWECQSVMDTAHTQARKRRGACFSVMKQYNNACL